MAEKTLYKYLDVDGGLVMLEHHNLQFTYQMTTDPEAFKLKEKK